jgi:DNA repair protein RecO (recombination protein O)
LNVIAKGAMLTTSKFGASLEPMSYILAVLYKKETRELQFLSQADIIKPFLRLYSDHNKSTIGLSICEIVYKLIKFEEGNQRIFKLILNVLDRLNDSERNEINLLWYFIVHFLGEIGFKINFSRCALCGEKLTEGNLSQRVAFVIDKGGFLCSKCGVAIPEAKSYSISTFKSLSWIEKAKLENVTNLKNPSNINNEIKDLLSDYIKAHAEGMVELKLLEIYDKLK